MRASAYSSVFALAAACMGVCASPALGSASDSTTPPSFPTQFRGDWYAAPGACDKDKIALQIGATSLNFFDEFSGQLGRVVLQADHEVRYVARYEADGRSWEAIETLSLSADGKEMKLEPERTSPHYFRCTVSAH